MGMLRQPSGSYSPPTWISAENYRRKCARAKCCDSSRTELRQCGTAAGRRTVL